MADLDHLSIQTVALAMPLLASAWTDGTMPAEDANGLALTVGAGSWRAPFGGVVRSLTRAGDADGVTLLDPAGTPVTGTATVVSLLPLQELRLNRLYATVLEDPASARPGRARGLPARPVPVHVVLHGVEPSQSSNLGPGDDLGTGSLLSFHDHHGLPVDPLAVASAFAALMDAHNALQQRTLGSPYVTSSQVHQIAQLGAAEVHLRLTGHDGIPNDGTNLTGLSAVDAASGRFTATTSTGASDLTAVVGKAPGTGGGGTFPDEDRRVLKLGLGTTGRLTDSVSFPARPAGTTLRRDLFGLRVVNLRTELVGTPDPAWIGTQMHSLPAIRIHEQAQLLADGNDVLGAAVSALAGAATESLVVAPVVDAAFTAPPAAGTAAHWPGFPATAASPAAAGPLALALRAAFAPAAQQFDDGNAAIANTDVILRVSGLPAEAAVRVFTRRFDGDAVETRGDGAGGIAGADGTVSLRLRDPLGLRRPGVTETAITFPSGAVIHVDVVVVKRTGEARIYGDVTAAVGGTTTVAPATASNPFGGAARRAICPAGILAAGSTRPAPPSTSLLDAVLAMTGEGVPRESPRLPGMARRDLMVAGLATTAGWRAVLSGGRLAGELASADPRRGSPGGTGGREVQAVGVSTTGGRLAYDVARMAFRRTTNVVPRILALAGAPWAEPAEPAEANGTFAGAVLQTVAPACETPELSLLQAAVESWASRPSSWSEIVDWLDDQIQNNLPGGLPQEVQDWLDEQLRTQLAALRTNPAANRLFDEVERELVSSIYGRRDAQWALAAAFGRACRSVYIETPALAPTAGAAAPYAIDLWKVLGDRLLAAPGLHVTVCVTRDDHPRGFEAWTDREAPERAGTLLGLPTATLADPTASRVVAFHPIGFPGRRARLESTVVVVDDTWMLIGSSTLRRRGLTFDGGADIVLSDMDLEAGVSPRIAALRRALIAARLGVTPGPAPPAIPDGAWVRLADGVQAFHEVRARLRAGGLGTIERLWDGVPAGRPASPAPADVVNPDGLNYPLVPTLAQLALVGASAY